MMNAMPISSRMLTNMWARVILYAYYVLNRVLHKRDKTQYQLWKGFAPNLNIKVWGCFAMVGLPDFQRSKISPKTIGAIFIGHAHSNVVYKFSRKDDFGFGAIRESRDVEFF